MITFFKSKIKPTKKSFQLSELIEILQDGVVITRESGEIIYLNKAAYFFLQIPPQTEIAKLNFLNMFVKDSHQLNILKEQLELTGLIRNHELELLTLDKETLDVILTANILGDYRQETFGFLYLFKDVSELKKIQQQLLQTQKLESVGLMASGIAHDFNNILAAIIPNAELIKLSGIQNDPNFKRAEIIEKSAHRASEIAQRLLTFTRQSDQRNFDQVDINQVIEDSIELLEHGFPENVKLKKLFHTDLNSIYGDAAQLQQVIMNLLINALDAMPEGGIIELITENFPITKYYQIGSLDPGDYIRISIRDSGTGIPLEIMSKIFDPFFTTKDVGKGTGLGLSVVYGIIKGLNGHIEVSSKVNEGSRFEIYLPVKTDISVYETSVEQEIHRGKGQKFLVVDDEDYVLNILSDTLEYLGYQVTKFNNGMMAVSYFRENLDSIHYAIIDLKMPEMDGRLTSSELRKIKPELKIIYTSGFDDTPISDANMEGVVGFLKKPYSIGQVSKTLKQIIEE